MGRRTKKRASSGVLGKVLISICAITTALAVVICAFYLIHRGMDLYRLRAQQQEMLEMKKLNSVKVSPVFVLSTPVPEVTAELAHTPDPTPEPAPVEYEILPEYRALYEINPDLIGWLKIDDTLIDYPVVQTPEDEEEYLNLDFYHEPNSNGTLIMDTDSIVGVGTAEMEYVDGVIPSTNLIIHGHTMKSGEMFGNLIYYQNEEYGREHSIIYFDSLYEHRAYELIAVFYSQVYYAYEDVFKYYKFFQADTQEEFDDWYDNIKQMSLYDTGVSAELGDEFITLSSCSYQVEDGRFVVVGKRIDPDSIEGEIAPVETTRIDGSASVME